MFLSHVKQYENVMISRDPKVCTYYNVPRSAIAMDKNTVAKFCSQGLVCVSDLCVCIRPLKPVDC